MQTKAIVSRLLRCCEPLMHAARWQALRDVAVSAVSGRALTALALGTTRADMARFNRELLGAMPQHLHLIGRRHVRSNNSWMHNYHRLVKGKARNQLLMHPDDLAAHGLTSGQVVELSSRIGKLHVPVEATTDVMPGVVCLPHGWGHDREGARMQVPATTISVTIRFSMRYPGMRR